MGWIVMCRERACLWRHLAENAADAEEWKGVHQEVNPGHRVRILWDGGRPARQNELLAPITFGRCRQTVRV